jgi:predicted DNA-binding protein
MLDNHYNINFSCYIKPEIDNYWLSKYLSKKLPGANQCQSIDQYLHQLEDAKRQELLNQINQAWRTHKSRKGKATFTVSLSTETEMRLNTIMKERDSTKSKVIESLINKEANRLEALKRKKQGQAEWGTNWGINFDGA